MNLDPIPHATVDDPNPIYGQLREEYPVYYVEERRQDPRNDLISLLLTSSEEGRALSKDELLGLCFLLLVAGTETTTSALGNAMLLLERFPDARKALIEDPTLIPSAAEEILRYDSPVQGLSRVVRRDVELHGRTIPRGARVHRLYAAANRDPRAFEDPDRFDIERTPNNHLSFGFGIHFCLGASLARLELTTGIEALLARAPHFRLLTEGLERLPSDTNRGFATLPTSL